ncbi:protein of unknown function [Shewanella benthica]|uniref:Uncharacterized protein n=1 Tax=Shewanella benthica TaxID=43661 RepID=A0A330M9N3_9GAMM|nr:protein of unknown function [Shewanella benthica]
MWDQAAAGCLANQLHTFIQHKNIDDLIMLTHSNGGNIVSWMSDYNSTRLNGTVWFTDKQKTAGREPLSHQQSRRACFNFDSLIRNHI